MANHPRIVEGFDGTLDELVVATGDITKGITAPMIQMLASDIHRQADADLKRARKKLSSQLYHTARDLYHAQAHVEILHSYFTRPPFSEKIAGFDGSLEELAFSIGNMTYDCVASYIEKLALQIGKQADLYADGKYKSDVADAMHRLYFAKNHMTHAWKICEPYMNDK